NLAFLISPEPSNGFLRRSKCVRFLHPRLGKKCVFIVSEDTSSIFELQKVSLSKRSLFVGNQIVKNGDFFILSPINVVYLFLPALLKMDKFTTFDVLTRSESAPGFPEIFSDSTFEKICEVCEHKVTCGLKVLRLDEAKLMKWLQSSVDRICMAASRLSDSLQLKQLQIALASQRADSAAVAPLFAEDSTAARALLSGDLHEGALRSFAFQLIADKLPGEFIEKLHTSLGLSACLPAIHADKENTDVVIGSSEKKACHENGPTEDYSKNFNGSKAASVKTASETKRMKMARGTKSITAFFGKT
uniref:Ribonuclease H2 subunit B n=3 Tax=Mesocestoides corti TaxID=53468 RepID=A0A5K3FFI9_MESCO